MLLLLLVEAVVAVNNCSAVALIVEVDIVLAVAVVVDCVGAGAAGCCSLCNLKL